MLLTGHLYKQSNLKLSWNKRYMSYNPTDHLLTYSNNIELTNPKIHRIIEIKESKEIGLYMNNNETLIMMDSENNELVFTCESENEKSKWLHCVSTSLNNNVNEENEIKKQVLDTTKHEPHFNPNESMIMLDNNESILLKNNHGISDEEFQELYNNFIESSNIENINIIIKWLQNFHKLAILASYTLIEEYALPNVSSILTRFEEERILLSTLNINNSSSEKYFYYHKAGLLLNFCHDSNGIESDDQEDEYQMKNAGLVLQASSNLMKFNEDTILRCGYFCLIDYLGFRVKVSSVVRTSQKLIHGCDHENKSFTDKSASIASQLGNLAKKFNIKESEIDYGGKLKTYFGTSAIVTAPDYEQCQPSHSFGCPFYLHWQTSPMPMDGFQINKNTSGWPIHKLRNEFVENYKLPLSSTTFTQESSGANEENELAAVAATEFLLANTIHDFAINLFLTPFYSSSELSTKLHKTGINVRQLGVVYSNCVSFITEFNIVNENSDNPITFVDFLNKKLKSSSHESTEPKTNDEFIVSCRYVLSQLLVEMIARTCKNLLKCNLRKVLRLAKKVNTSETENDIDSFKRDLFDEIKGGVCDFFNLVLGTTEDSKTFISGSITKRLNKKFNQEFEYALLNSVSKARLLIALQFHCNVYLDNRDYDLSSKNPIEVSDIQLSHQLKTMNSVINSIVAKLPSSSGISTFASDFPECINYSFVSTLSFIVESLTYETMLNESNESLKSNHKKEAFEITADILSKNTKFYPLIRAKAYSLQILSGYDKETKLTAAKELSFYFGARPWPYEIESLYKSINI